VKQRQKKRGLESISSQSAQIYEEDSCCDVGEEGSAELILAKTFNHSKMSFAAAFEEEDDLRRQLAG